MIPVVFVYTRHTRTISAPHDSSVLSVAGSPRLRLAFHANDTSNTLGGIRIQGCVCQILARRHTGLNGSLRGYQSCEQTTSEVCAARHAPAERFGHNNPQFSQGRARSTRVGNTSQSCILEDMCGGPRCSAVLGSTQARTPAAS